MFTRNSLIALGVFGLATSAAAAGFFDFGLFRDQQLDAHSEQMFGVIAPVGASSTDSIGGVLGDADPTALVTLAKGLRARVVSARQGLGPNIDMMALWPNDANPTHIIACNEEGTAQPGLQRIRLSDGTVETILTGTSSCDPVKRTAWGTIVFGEENGSDGWVLEMVDPLGTTGVTFNRGAGTTSGGVGAANIVTRPAVGRLSFEGLAVLPNGVMYYGDENRPGTGTAGGAYFKFIPSSPWGGGTISNLAQSPLASGTVYGLRLGKRNGNTDYGQGTQTGLGTWINVDGAKGNLRSAASANKLTGYYRPEDAEVDPSALAEGNVRFCTNNTGNEGNDRNWGETICVADGTVAEATANTGIPEVQYFLMGNWDLAMMDNLAYQPGRGNWVIHEDGDGPEVGRNNDLWLCLPDGDDPDTLSDGCIRIATLNDLTAEWTGGTFNRWGDRFFVSVQHNATGHGVILEITGWR